MTRIWLWRLSRRMTLFLISWVRLDLLILFSFFHIMKEAKQVIEQQMEMTHRKYNLQSLLGEGLKKIQTNKNYNLSLPLERIHRIQSNPNLMLLWKVKKCLLSLPLPFLRVILRSWYKIIHPRTNKSHLKIKIRKTWMMHPKIKKELCRTGRLIWSRSIMVRLSNFNSKKMIN